MQSVNFITPFYAPPVILTTVINDGSSNVVSSLKDPMNSWLEVCLKLTFTMPANLRIFYKTATEINKLEWSNVERNNLSVLIL